MVAINPFVSVIGAKYNRALVDGNYVITIATLGDWLGNLNQ